MLVGEQKRNNFTRSAEGAIVLVHLKAFNFTYTLLVMHDKMKILFTALCIFIFSCESIQKEINKEKDDTLRISSNTLIDSEGDTTFYMQERTRERNVFISILPSDEWIDSMQSIYSEDDWNKVVFDNEHYRNQTEEYLKSKGYVEMHRPKEGLWVIKRPNCHTNVINIDTLADKCGVIIFNGDNEPIFYNGTAPELDLLTL